MRKLFELVRSTARYTCILLLLIHTCILLLLIELVRSPTAIYYHQLLRQAL